MVVGDDQVAGDIERYGACVFRRLRAVSELPCVLWRPRYWVGGRTTMMGMAGRFVSRKTGGLRADAIRVVWGPSTGQSATSDPSPPPPRLGAASTGITSSTSNDQHGTPQPSRPVDDGQSICMVVL